MKVRDYCGLEQMKACKLWKTCSDELSGDDELPPCASKLVEAAPSASNNTGSPKLPTLAEVEQAFCISEVAATEYTEEEKHGVTFAYNYICRQLRAGA